jgi:hypothetical protein
MITIRKAIAVSLRTLLVYAQNGEVSIHTFPHPTAVSRSFEVWRTGTAV